MPGSLCQLPCRAFIHHAVAGRFTAIRTGTQHGCFGSVRRCDRSSENGAPSSSRMTRSMEAWVISNLTLLVTFQSASIFPYKQLSIHKKLKSSYLSERVSRVSLTEKIESAGVLSFWSLSPTNRFVSFIKLVLCPRRLREGEDQGEREESHSPGSVVSTASSLLSRSHFTIPSGGSFLS